MAVSPVAKLAYTDATVRSTHTRVIPTGAVTGTRVFLGFVIGSGSRNVAAELTHADGTTRPLTLLAPKAVPSGGGHASYVWDLLADGKTAGATVTFRITNADGTTASFAASITVTVLDGADAPHAFASAATGIGSKTKTAPQVAPTIDGCVPLVLACDTVGGTAPTTPTTVWTTPADVSLVVADYPPGTASPLPTHAVGGAFAKPVPANLNSPAYVFTSDASAIGSSWTILYPATVAATAAQPTVVTASGYDDATARSIYNRLMPAAATAGRRVLCPPTLASGSRLLTATLRHVDGTSRTVSEVAPKAALTNGGHGQYVVEFECDAKTAGATLELKQSPADGSPDSGLKASIPLLILDGVGKPVLAATVGHSIAGSSKTTPAVTTPVPDLVEVSLVSDSRGGTSPVTPTGSWAPPDGFTRVVFDNEAGTTASPVSSSAVGVRLDVRLPADSPAGGRVWVSKDAAGALLSNVGASWTILYPTSQRNASGIFASVGDGWVALELIFP